MNHTSKGRGRSTPSGYSPPALLGAATILATATATAGTTACAICGKNLIKNPGAEAGLGIMAVDASGAVPGWTSVAGDFGAASYSFPNGWFSAEIHRTEEQGSCSAAPCEAERRTPATGCWQKRQLLPYPLAHDDPPMRGWLVTSVCGDDGRVYECCS